MGLLTCGSLPSSAFPVKAYRVSREAYLAKTFEAFASRFTHNASRTKPVAYLEERSPLTVAAP